MVFVRINYCMMMMMESYLFSTVLSFLISSSFLPKDPSGIALSKLLMRFPPLLPNIDWLTFSNLEKSPIRICSTASFPRYLVAVSIRFFTSNSMVFLSANMTQNVYILQSPYQGTVTWTVTWMMEVDTWGQSTRKYPKIPNKCVAVQTWLATNLWCGEAPSALPVMDTADGQDKAQAEPPGQQTHLKIFQIENRKYLEIFHFSRPPLTTRQQQ